MRKYEGTMLTDNKGIFEDMIRDREDLLKIGVDYTLSDIHNDGKLFRVEYELTTSGIADDAPKVHKEMMEANIILYVTTEEVI